VDDLTIVDRFNVRSIRALASDDGGKLFKTLRRFISSP
jgi:hypothetical protein